MYTTLMQVMGQADLLAPSSVLNRDGSAKGSSQMTLVFDHYERRRLRLLAEECFGASVLDLGHAQMPNPFLRGLRTTGLDLTRSINGAPYEEEISGDVRDIPSVLHGRRFDNIVAGELIEHLEEPYDFLRSLHPHISPGGRLVISTPNPLAWPTLLLELASSRRWFYTREHKFYFTPRWVVRMLEETGFKVTGIRSVGLWAPMLTLPCPVALSYQVIYRAEPW